MFEQWPPEPPAQLPAKLGRVLSIRRSYRQAAASFVVVSPGWRSAYSSRMKKKQWRAYLDANGESHVEEADVDLTLTDYAPPAPRLHVSAARPAAAFAYLSAPPGWDGGWHPSPRRQLFIVLHGVLEGEVSDGRSVRLEAGDVILLEDTSGRGHASRVVGNENVEALVVVLPD